MDDDLALFPNPLADDGGNVTVYQLDTNQNWVKLTSIVSDDTDVGDRFGNSVAIDDETIVVGSVSNDTDGINSGAAFVFERTSQDSWTQTQRLSPDDAAQFLNFGSAVSVSGDHMIVGAINAEDAGSLTGAAYIFERDSSGDWQQVSRLTAPAPTAGAFFGGYVDVSGDTAIVGDNNEAVYVYERQSDGSWTFHSTLQGDEAADVTYFGRSLAIDNDQIVVGAEGDSEIGYSTGAVYVYDRDAEGNWNQSAKLFAGDPGETDAFGATLGLSGNRIVVGAPGNDDLGADSGSAYLFERQSDGSWSQRLKLLPSDGGILDGFGRVAISSEQVFVGSSVTTDVVNGTRVGVGYAYDVSLQPRVLEQYVENSGPVGLIETPFAAQVMPTMPSCLRPPFSLEMVSACRRTFWRSQEIFQRELPATTTPRPDVNAERATSSADSHRRQLSDVGTSAIIHPADRELII
ncbi:MAG: FG-GAP repeat protein [Pirellulaceae bacterium]